MHSILRPVLLVAVCASSAFASDLHLSVKNGGQNSIKVSPGAIVPYTVFGELSDAQNEGLALFCFDLAFTGGPLAPAAAPTSGPMANFTVPLGLNNPGGFGGTVQGGVLRQVGGGQNTIRNIFAPFPTGSVLTGIAQPGTPASLASGNVVAPYKVGAFTLVPSNLVANAITLGETGIPFWHVDPVSLGTISPLTITVEALSGNVSSISIAAQQSQMLSLDAGPANAGRTYLMLGSASGTTPGVTLGNGIVIPLNPDPYYNFLRANPSPPWLSGSFGTLDAQGRASVQFKANKRFLNATVNHAFILLNPINFVSNPVSCQVLP